MALSELQQPARPRHLDAERDAPRSAGQPGRPGDADAGEAAVAGGDQSVQGADQLPGRTPAAKPLRRDQLRARALAPERDCQLSGGGRALQQSAVESVRSLADPGDAQRHAARRDAGSRGRRQELVGVIDADARAAGRPRRAVLSRPPAQSILHDADLQRGGGEGRALGRLAVQEGAPRRVTRCSWRSPTQRAEEARQLPQCDRASSIARSSPVYIDDCCHYTLRGNQLLADSIARQILESKGPWR